MDYWQSRSVKAQERLAKSTRTAIEKQLSKYYKTTMDYAIGSYLSVYNKVQQTKEAGIEPTPADLYKLDTYWKLQGEMKYRLQALGEKESKLFTTNFIDLFKNIYEGIDLGDNSMFATFDLSQAEQMIKQIWCTDGKSWSDRIWNNVEKLQQALNDGLFECVVAGRSPEQLKDLLMNEFNVSYSQADSVVRTEISHIQTQAARQRYDDAGIQKIQVWASKWERQCDVCGKLHEKVFNINEKMPIPAHPFAVAV